MPVQTYELVTDDYTLQEILESSEYDFLEKHKPSTLSTIRSLRTTTATRSECLIIQSYTNKGWFG